MPKNSLYSFIKDKKNSYHLKNDLAIKESNNRRKAFYVELISNPTPRSLLKSTYLSGFIFTQSHLSIDEYYLSDNPDMPSEHYSAIYLNRALNQKIVLHINDIYNPTLIKGKKYSQPEELEVETFEIDSTQDISCLKDHLQPYKTIHTRFITDHKNVTTALQKTIDANYNLIAYSIHTMNNASKDNQENKFTLNKNVAIETTQALLKSLEIYNLYNNHIKAHGVRYCQALLEQLQERQLPTSSNPAPISEVESLSLSTQETPPISVKVVPEPPSTLKKLMDDIENLNSAIKEIQNEKAPSAEKTLRINSIKNQLKEQLLILFLDHTTKKSIELNQFIAEQERYLKTLDSVEDYFKNCVDTGDLEGVKFLYPHLKEKIEAGNIEIFIRLIKNIFSNSIGAHGDFPAIADYFFTESSPGYRIAFDFSKMIYTYTPETGLVHSSIHHYFIANNLKAFNLLLQSEAIKNHSLFFAHDLNIRFNIIQSVILQFPINRNLDFIRLFNQMNLLNTPILMHPSFDPNVINKFKDISKENRNDTVGLEALYKKTLSLSYFESAIYLHINVTQYDSLELVYYLAEQVDLTQLCAGMAFLLNDKTISSRMLYSSEASLFLDSREACEIETKKRGLENGQLTFIFYASEKTNNKTKEITHYLFPIMLKRFRLLSINEQHQWIENLENTAKHHFSEKQFFNANGYILIAQILNSLNTNLSEFDYKKRLQLIFWRAKIAEKIQHNVASYLYQAALRIADNIPSSIRKKMDKIKECTTLFWTIQEKNKSIQSNLIGNNSSTFHAPSKNNAVKNISTLLQAYGMDPALSNSHHYELLLRKIASNGAFQDMKDFFNASTVKMVTINVNAQGKETGKTALHQLIFSGNQASKTNEEQEQYRLCLSLLLEHHAENSWNIVDVKGKKPYDYNTSNTFLLHIVNRPGT